MIEAKKLTKVYKKQTVLDGVSFTLETGKVLGILGPNGAGKTTLIKILALIAQPNSGTLCYNGLDSVVAARQIRPSLGYVPQDVALFDDLSVWDNLLWWSTQRGQKAKAQARELINKLCLGDFASKKVSTLSGGMKRRVNLAVALLDNPQLLILDEPLVGVDIEQRRLIVDCLKELAEVGVTQIIASHHVDELVPLADLLMVMKDGHILFLDTTQALVHLRDAAGPGATLDGIVLNMLRTTTDYHEKEICPHEPI